MTIIKINASKYAELIGGAFYGDALAELVVEVGE